MTVSCLISARIGVNKRDLDPASIPNYPIANAEVPDGPTDPDRAGHLSSLGKQLGRRFERTGSMEDLNRAVDVADMAVKATPQDPP
ncbi:hypothetical protein CIHG_07123 [Coccidioides immitis H538.4]|uniref:Uncharacterized protein n=2 Tax=Coccidioides immitis TaxID=5501 RepID=A0A0J8RYD5_COCIT|nr:hypothetical protein CIRG_08636 [Coccidioides immitis RMSCC 2394]KMU89189.1 hypothetical protein CIHG_07123 [Coccidioides immitis H538.4]